MFRPESIGLALVDDMRRLKDKGSVGATEVPRRLVSKKGGVQSVSLLDTSTLEATYSRDAGSLVPPPNRLRSLRAEIKRRIDELVDDGRLTQEQRGDLRSAWDLFEADCFEHLSGHFALEAMRTKVFELSNLLSILIAYPLSVISVRVAGKNGAAHHVYFSTFKPVERDPSDNHFPWRCFIQQPSIHDRWEMIVNRYFNSTYRKVSWTRLAGMQRYEGFWEYRALGYVSLIDQYVDQRHREAKSAKKIPVSVGAKAKTKLDAALKSLSPPLPESRLAAIIGIIGNIFSHKRELEFEEKYRRAISTANQDIVKIIGISDADFNLIKRVRNNIAHGKAIDLPDASLQRIETVVSKLILLMTYWALLDVGLTDDDFFRCLRSTHHPIRFSAELNIAHLDRTTNPESFFSVSRAQFDRISRVKGIRANACFSLSKSGTIRYSKKYSEAHHHWITSRPTGSGMTTHSDLFGVPQERVSYVTPLYIESGDELLRLETAFVIRNA